VNREISRVKQSFGCVALMVALALVAL